MIQITQLELLRGGKSLLKDANATLYPKHKEVLEKRITSTKGLKKVANALFDKYIVEYSKDEYFETSISLFAEPEEVRFLCEYRGFAADFRKYLEKFVPESSKLR